MTPDELSPSLRRKLTLAVRVFWWFTVIHVWLRRRPLAEVVDRLGSVSAYRRPRINGGVLGRGVARLLHIGPFRARCLITSLVHFRLLREQGDNAQLLIGLEDTPRTKDAHAWVEIDGIDIGPPPGRGAHKPLLRFG
jgi:Transglutaminase-like superfamily